MTPTPLADAGARTYFQLARLEVMDQWWHWMLLTVIIAAVVVYVVWVYRRDSVELPRGVAWLLALLRLTALAALLFYFFGPEMRTERKLLKDSRLVLLVDTSQSMGLKDAADGTATSVPAGGRIEQVIAALSGQAWLDELRTKHDVIVSRFDQADTPTSVAMFEKTGPTADEQDVPDESAERAAALRQVRMMLVVAAAILLVATAAGVIHLFTSRAAAVAASERESWGLLVCIVALIVAVVVAGVASLRHRDVTLAAALGLRSVETPEETEAAVVAQEAQSEPTAVDWPKVLAPGGGETRLGAALLHAVEAERGGSLAAIVVLSDGASNAGIEYTAAVETAKQAHLPIYTVGLGSRRRPKNVQLVDIEAPPRVFPGDAFTLTGFLQASGLEGRSVQVDLLAAPEATGDQQQQEGTFQDEHRVQLGADGQLVPVKFEVTPEETGRFVYQLRVTPPSDDSDASDDTRDTTVQVVERKNRVLLLAGGPTREYRFVRNLLFRDRDTTVDVLLQTASAGISQEADDILFDFPVDAEEVFQYDAIVAFDPDWSELDELQIKTLERWVAEKAGGLIVVAGPVYTSTWAEKQRGDARIDTIKGLYPVTFFSRASATLRRSRTGGQAACPIRFTEEGRRAQFLWLGDTPGQSELAWTGFEGVYGYFLVRDAKPGATVYTEFVDSDAGGDDRSPPIYMAGQFYGSGRVFFMASGEMWRLRGRDPAQFEQFYTKLIRYVTQGRLLRDSTRGVLMVDKPKCLLGDTVTVRATLTDALHEPLTVEEVEASLVMPDESRKPLVLRKLPGPQHLGVYAAQFTPLVVDDHRIELPIPDSPEGELLVRDVQVRGSNLEVERPERNDPLLSDIAASTGGAYYVGMDAALSGVAAAGNRAEAPSLAAHVAPNDQQTYLPGTPDKNFDRQLMTWLLLFICGVLSLEWLIRRLNKLA